MIEEQSNKMMIWFVGGMNNQKAKKYNYKYNNKLNKRITNKIIEKK